MQAAPDASAPLRGRALYNAGRLAHFQGDYAEAEHLLGQSLTILRAADDEQQLPRALEHPRPRRRLPGRLPAVPSRSSRRPSSWTSGSATRSARRPPAPTWRRALLEQGDLTGASALLHASIPVYRQQGDDWGLAVGISRLGIVARLQGDLDRALALSRESVQLCRGIDDRRVMANAVQTIGLVAAGAR